MKESAKITSGLFWKFSERIAAQLVSFGVSVLLARLLEPSYYGLISLVTVFITLANVVVASGLGSALVQKKDADDLDFSSVFYVQLALAVLLYLALFVSAPWIGRFFGKGYDNFVDVIRVLGLNIPVIAVYNVQQAYVSRKMIFRKFFIATLSGTVISGVIGVYMAYTGWGVWALVGQYLSSSLINTIVLALVVDWRPRLAFSVRRLKPLLRYGWKLFAVDLVNAVLNDLRAIIIGAGYTTEDLAFYNRGEQFPSLIVTNINSSIQSVLFPAMSNIQEDPNQVKALLRQTISIGSFVIFPLIFGFMAVSDSVIRLLLTDKWADCIPYVQIFCVSYSMRIISTSCAQSLKAMGRSDIYLKGSSVYKTLELISILITAMIGVWAIAVSTAINAAILVMINYVCNRKVIGYTLREFGSDILPNTALSLAMAVPVFLMCRLSGSVAMVALQVFTGAVIYIAGAWLLKLKSFGTMLTMVKNYTKKEKA